jgi:hypothetical protein
MTIDFNLRVLPLPDRAFLPGTGFPMLEGQNIVELKYRVALPGLFKQLVERFKLRRNQYRNFAQAGGARSHA